MQGGRDQSKKPTIKAMIKNIAFFVYPVRDVARSRKFYEGTLGLVPGMNYENVWVEYDIDSGTIAISTMLEHENPGARGGMVAFEVDDFDATVAKLKTEGVSFSAEPFDTPVCRAACIADPDGNIIMLHKKK
jgi:predicted enzyme related to lactoylglutathione lyase